MTEPAPLVSIPAAPAPLGAAAEWLQGAGGVRLRAALIPCAGDVAPRGSVVLSPGRTEAIEKYFEVAGELAARGFVVLVHDWRGQGLSDRALADRLKGHAAGFEPFIDDYARLLDHFEARLPRPWIAMGHSMGGCLTLIALAKSQGPRFAGAILSAPMLGLNTGRRSPASARALAWIMRRAGRAEDYVLGDPGDPFASRFEANPLTRDRTRFERAMGLITASPDLALGAPTWSWLDFAFSATAWLRRAPQTAALDIPVRVLAAGEDALVSNAAVEAVTARLPQGRYEVVPGARHEILMETDDIRAVFWRVFDDLADAVTTPRA